MPIIKSALKRARQTVKRRSHNLQVKRAIHDDIRVLQDAIVGKDTEAIITAFKAAQSEIDRAVKKGTLHRNTAARRKAQLSSSVARATKAAPVVEAKSTKGAGSTAKKAAKPTARKTATKAPVKKAASK